MMMLILTHILKYNTLFNSIVASSLPFFRLFFREPLEYFVVCGPDTLALLHFLS